MGPNLIALAIPGFFAFMGLEVLVARVRRLRVYNFSDTITDLACGVGEQTVMFFFTALLVAAYAGVYQHARVFTFAAGSPWEWVSAFLGVELAYYWWHRLSHVVNFLWAVHVVHHQSEEMNLSVALRQAILTNFTQLPFYLPMAVLGVSPLPFVAMNSISTLYQFFIHTELVGTLGPAEAVLNTPSAHRVHHAVNHQYLDKNYGGILIIWDRIFRSFIPEGITPVYGLSKPLRSFNPMWVQFHYWFEMAQLARQAPSFSQGVQVLFRGPSWHPVWLREAPVDVGDMTRETFAKYQPVSPISLRVYVGLHFLYVVVATFALLMWGDAYPRPATIIFVGLVLMSLQTWGGLLESKRWSVPFEIGRLAAIAAAAIAWFWGTAWQPWAVAGAVAFAVGSTVWLLRGAKAPALAAA